MNLKKRHIVDFSLLPYLQKRVEQGVFFKRPSTAIKLHKAIDELRRSDYGSWTIAHT